MKPITVALPLGIGDTHWALQKMRALKELHGGAPLHAHINESTDHRTVGYLNMVPFVDKAVLDKTAPFDIAHEMSPFFKDPRWSSLEGCRGWKTFDYILVANGHLESGRHISDFLPELQTEYDVEVVFNEATEKKSLDLMPTPTVLLYPSGTGPNSGFHGDWWTPDNWHWVVRGLNECGVTPLFVGAPTESDMGYMRQIERRCRVLAYKTVVGQTSIPDYLKLIQRCTCWCGLNSGGGMVAASMGTPTVMMWSDENHSPGPHPGFVSAMQTGWLPRSRLHTYRTLSYGSAYCTPAQVVAKIVEVVRG